MTTDVPKFIDAQRHKSKYIFLIISNNTCYKVCAAVVQGNTRKLPVFHESEKFYNGLSDSTLFLKSPSSKSSVKSRAQKPFFKKIHLIKVLSSSQSKLTITSLTGCFTTVITCHIMRGKHTKHTKNAGENYHERTIDRYIAFSVENKSFLLSPF